MLVGDKDTVLLIPAYEKNGVPQMVLPTGGESVPFDVPTVELMNYWIDTLTPASAGAHWGGNITCDVIDDWELASTDSATNTARTLCSVGKSEDLTFYNYNANMNFLRDINPQDATSEFNLARNLTRAPDLAYVIAHRIGYSRIADAEIGQEWHYYYVWTDHSVPGIADGEYQTIGQAFIPKGVLNFKHILGA